MPNRTYSNYMVWIESEGLLYTKMGFSKRMDRRPKEIIHKYRKQGVLINPKIVSVQIVATAKAEHVARRNELEMLNAFIECGFLERVDGANELFKIVGEPYTIYRNLYNKGYRRKTEINFCLFICGVTCST